MKWTDELRRVLQRMRGERPATQPPGGVDCHEALQRIFEWLDDELDAENAAGVGEHLETCALCYPRLAFERAFLEALENAPQRELAAVELRERVLDALVEQGFSIR